MIAFYLRLSVSDGDLGADNKDESNSIESQRLLLEDYIADHDELVDKVVEYVDDGYTGTNFNRPAFKQMIEDVKKGKISTIIVKDLSRFGRNYIEVGDYIEQLFPLLGIRFIAVNHNYDSNDYIGEPMGFDMEINSLISTFYSRDLSIKRKSTNRVKWKNGHTTCGIAPYGYVKDKNNKGKFAIDPEAAEVVKLIFNKAAEGYGTSAIAEYLNQNKIPTRSVYNRRKKINNDKIKITVSENEQLWDNAKVLDVIRKYEYTGALVSGRTSPVRIGSSYVRQNDKEDWVIVENAWEPIISKELYEKANSFIKRINRDSYVNQKNYALKGKLKCGNCNLNLEYVHNTTEPMYKCAHKKKTGAASACSEDRYLVKDVESRVFFSLKKLFRLVSAVNVKVNEDSHTGVDKDIKNNVSQMEKEIRLLKQKRITLYEMYAEGHFDEDIYLKKKEVINSKIDSLMDKKQQSEIIIAEDITEKEDVNKLISKVDAYKEETELTRAMVNAFIDVVYIYSGDRMKIVYKNEDRLYDIIEKWLINEKT